jgi:hypothetical protein
MVGGKWVMRGNLSTPIHFVARVPLLTLSRGDFGQGSLGVFGHKRPAQYGPRPEGPHSQERQQDRGIWLWRRSVRTARGRSQ